MKASLALSLLGATLALTACETRVVEHHPRHRHAVYANTSDERIVYRNDRYQPRYHDNHTVYRAYGGSNRDYPRRSVDRTYAF